MDKKTAIKVIKIKADHSLPLDDQQKFIETVEIELRALHEGNIARYRLSTSEYVEWHKV